MTTQNEPVNIPPIPLKCYPCGEKEMALVAWIERSGAPHDHPEHRYGYSTKEFVRCAQCGAGEIVRHSHDCWSFDPYERGDYYDWYPLSAPDAALLEGSIRAHCPAPLDPACPCAAHEALQRQVQRLPLRPSPPRPGEAAARSEPVHATRVVNVDGHLQLVRDCGALHTGDIVPRARISGSR